MKWKVVLIILSLIIIASCSRTIKTENEVVQFINIGFSKSFFVPGEPVTWEVQVETDLQSIEVQVIISHGRQILALWEEQKSIAKGCPFSFQWDAPQDAPRGYGIDIYTRAGADGDWVLLVSAGFDVLEHWTQTPRYGFLTDFSPERSDIAATIQTLNRFHINGLQFYDWMYKHEDYLTDADIYIDPLGRKLSLNTVSMLIEEAHKYRMAAMPYTAVYAATAPFFKAHPEWALYDNDQNPHSLGENFLIIMDTSPDSEFGQHLLMEFRDILENTAFDGIHLDQYGYPKQAYNINGERVNVEDNFVQMIDATKELALSQDSQDTVIFNAVNNWPVNKVALADQDLIYIEVWEPHDYFIDLYNLVRNAQRLNPMKPVVLAAYNNPEHIHNIILTDAIIFASGGSHIELGEEGRMLQDPYFPNYGIMSDELSEKIIHMYDFYVRYQDFIGPRTADASAEYKLLVQAENNDENEMIQPIFRQGYDFLTCSLINFTGITLKYWKGTLTSPPDELSDIEIQIDGIGKQVHNVWLASPDSLTLESIPVEFKQEGDKLTLTIPSLSYWVMVVIEVF